MLVTQQEATPVFSPDRIREFVIDVPGDIIAWWVKRYRYAPAARN